MAAGTETGRPAAAAGEAGTPAAPGRAGGPGRAAAARRAWAALAAVPTGRRVPGTVLVGLAAAAVGLVAGLVSHGFDLALLYSDAQSHLVIARRVVDSKTPGFVQLGTVWLPAPHLLLLPAVTSAWLWTTGWAGTLLGAACLGVSAGALYRVSVRLGLGRAGRLAALAVLLVNPGVLYLHTTALTEPVLLAAVLACAAGLSGWATAARPYSGGELAVFAGVPAAVAVLSRYEGWALAAAGTVLVVASAARRWGGVRYPLVLGCAFAAPPAVAAAWWISYNWVLFGDPLAFSRGEYSAAAQQAELADAGLLPTQGNLWLSVWSYHQVVVGALGLATVVAALVGAVVLVLPRRTPTPRGVVWMLAVFYPFAVALLVLGQTAVRTPATLPPGWFNVRFGTVLLPCAALLVGLAVQAVPGPRRGGGAGPGRALAAGAVVAALLVQSAWSLTDYPGRLPLLAEGELNAAGSASAAAAARWLGEHYDGGDVLLDDRRNPVLLRLGLPLREVFASFNGGVYDAALDDPVTHARWLYVNTGDVADRVGLRLRTLPAMAQRYDEVHADGPYSVYRRRDGGIWVDR